MKSINFENMVNTSILDIEKIRNDFPILSEKVNGKPLIYFDNAATSQTPEPVIQSIVDYYHHHNANVHRGVHTLSQDATDKYEHARDLLKEHFNAAYREEIIYTAGTTHSINLVASGLTSLIGKGDEIIVSTMEHHSNIVPLQFLCQRTGAKLKVIPITEEGELDLTALDQLFSDRTKLVFIGHVSNALGTINPIKEIAKKAHDHGAAIIVDGAQAVPHLKPDVQDLEVDFYAASGHKMCGPTGIGVLYGKKEWLEKLPPYQGGGEMIDQVTFEKTTFAPLPHKFEAGTPNICGGIALGAAVEYLNKIGFDKIAAYEQELLQSATKGLQEIEGIKIYGQSKHKTAVLSFNIEGLHPYDIGTIIDKLGIAIRTGHHCAQPIMDYYHIPGTARASLAFYNTKEEVQFFVDAVKKAKKMLS